MSSQFSTQSRITPAVLTGAVAGLILGNSALAADERRAEALDQRLRILERQVEIQKEEAAAAALKNPVVKAGEKGVSIATPDGSFVFNIKALVQGDHRVFFDDDNLTIGPPTNTADGFLLRRVRPSFEGQLGSLVAFRITPDFAPVSSTTVSSRIVDAYVDLKFSPAATLRAGKQKGPVSLERLQSGSAITFAERAFPTELAPNRDIGAQLQGDLAGGAANYAIGAFNGTPDGRDAAASDPDDNYEFAGRLFFQPWLNQADSPLTGLGLGIAATTGEVHSRSTFASQDDVLPRYRSPAQLTIFRYLAPNPASFAGTVVARGEHHRFSPQAYFYRGPFGLLGEYIVSDQAVGKGVANARLKHSAYAATASWVITGEDASFRGVARPRTAFNAPGGWGAFEVAARISGVDFDDDAFPVFASPTASVTEAIAYGVGLNWYLTSNIKTVFNYQQTQFEGGAAAGADRPDEKVFITRIQYAF